MDLAFKAISIPKASREMLEIPTREANPAFCLKRLNKPKNQSSEMPVFWNIGIDSWISDESLSIEPRCGDKSNAESEGNLIRLEFPSKSNENTYKNAWRGIYLFYLIG